MIWFKQPANASTSYYELSQKNCRAENLNEGVSRTTAHYPGRHETQESLQLVERPSVPG